MVMVVATLSLAAGTLLSFVMANAVVAARGFLLPYTCKKKDVDGGSPSKQPLMSEEDFLITSSYPHPG